MWRRQVGGLIEAYRWPLVGSVAALIAVVIVVALILAFCGGDDEDEGPAAATTPRPTRTVTPGTVTDAARTATAAATGTPGTPSPTVTRVPGEPSTVAPALPTETPSLPGAPETVGPGPPPEASPTPGAPGPTAPPVTTTPTPSSATSSLGPTSTPLPTATPVKLPDLVIRDLGVHYDRIWVRIGNDGEGKVPAGTKVDIRVRGIVAQSVGLETDLPPDGSYFVLLEEEVIYRGERVLVTVDPDNRIPEDDNNNNALSRWLEPDVPLDVAVYGISGIGTRLGVIVLNNCEAPLKGVHVRIRVFRAEAQQETMVSDYDVNLQPFEATTLIVYGVAAVPGFAFRVVMEVLNVTDINPANNTFEGVLS